MLQIILFLAASAASANAVCTKTKTTYTTIEAKTETFSSTLPTTTLFFYSSTVTVGTPYGGPHPTSTPTGNIYTCHYYTEPHVPPFEGSSSQVQSPSANVAARDANANPNPVTCTTIQKTVTVKHRCTETFVVYPGPAFVSKDGTTTMHVPDFCTGGGRQVKKDSNGQGNSLTLLGYPYFPQNPVECCVYCAQQVTANLVAAAQVDICQCLYNVDGDYPGKSNFCHKGLEPYGFRKKSGVGFAGPCRTKL